MKVSLTHNNLKLNLEGSSEEMILNLLEKIILGTSTKTLTETIEPILAEPITTEPVKVVPPEQGEEEEEEEGEPDCQEPEKPTVEAKQDYYHPSPKQLYSFVCCDSSQSVLIPTGSKPTLRCKTCGEPHKVPEELTRGIIKCECGKVTTFVTSDKTEFIKCNKCDYVTDLIKHQGKMVAMSSLR